MSESDHNSANFKHPKIAKNTSSKLPQAFFQSKSTVIIPKKVQQHKKKQQTANNEKIADKAVDKEKPQLKVDLPLQENALLKISQVKKKQSRNPLIPIRKLKQLMQRFHQQSKAMEQYLAGHKFQHLKISENSYHLKPQDQIEKLKYQDFITLTLISKKESMSLKKILHVPTLKVFYLRESLINLSIDKAQITYWMDNCNQKGKKIVQLFWSIPEGYYSLVYEYEEGVLMENLLDTLNTLPLPIIQNIAILHFTSNIAVYNSQLILNVGQNNTKPSLYYLPIYQETPPLIRSQKLSSIIREEIQQEDIDRKILWRLGIILMVSFLGEEFLRSDLLQLQQSSLKSCCLFHAVIQLENSLCRMYLEENQLFQQSQYLISFLCHLLSIKKSPTFTKSLSDQKIKKHKFLTHQYESLLSLQQLFHAIALINMQDCNYPLGQFSSGHKLKKTIDIIGLGLQNVDLSILKPIDFSIKNKNIHYIAHELGMRNNIDNVVASLKKVYQRQHS